MYRVSLANVAARRTCRPLYERHQATPYATFLDEAETGEIYSGMIVYRTGEDTVALLDGASATAKPFGLSALDKNDVINDLDGLNINPFAVWIGGPDAVFTIDAPAFDTSVSYTVNSNGSRTLLYAGTSTAKGKITSASTTAGPVAELLQVVSSTRIIVRLLQPAVAVA